MKPINQFADYNKENILSNALQAETHLKNVTKNTDPNYLSCVNKHLLEAQAELAELQGHEPEHQKEYRNLMMELRKLRKDNIKGIDTKEAISRLRAIRGDFERHVDGHDTEHCASCGSVDDAIKSFLNGTKPLKGEATQELIVKNKEHIMKMETELVANALAGNAIGEVVQRGVPMVLPGATMGIPNKSLANLGLGLVMTGLSLYGKLGKKLNTVGAVAGTNLIASETADIVMGYLPLPAPVAPTAMASAQAAPYAGGILSTAPYGTTGGPTGATAAYTNGSLVFVD